jgi:uncharacterized protein YcbX
MTRTDQRIDGRVLSLWRYPVKSMLGEELPAAQVDDRGVLGDRAYAVLDRADGKVATAKNPRKWPALFRFQGGLADPVRRGAPTPPARVTLPDGTALTSDQADVDEVLSRALGREVSLVATDQTRHEDVDSPLPTSWAARSEEYWPDMDGLDHRDTVTDFDLPEGTFFDAAVVHLLTTATLGRLGELSPRSRFDVRRFRPNVVVAPADAAGGFVENAWVGRSVRIGESVRLAVTEPCPRCVMTTLPQGDLPKDSDVLRTAARHNGVFVGVYASVLHGGRIEPGDPVTVQ